MEQPPKLDLQRILGIFQTFNVHVARPLGCNLSYFYGLNVGPVSALFTIEVEDRIKGQHRGFVINLHWKQPLERTIYSYLNQCIEEIRACPELNCSHRYGFAGCKCKMTPSQPYPHPQ